MPPVPPEPRAGASRNQPWERKGSQAEVREGRGQRAPRQEETSEGGDTEAKQESCRHKGHRRGAEGHRLVSPVPAKPSAQQVQSPGLHTPESSVPSDDSNQTGRRLRDEPLVN